jgi:ribosomal protein S18 acetylase RimI-like enzyme
MLPDLRLITREEWYLLRQVRLIALKESPHAFLATHEQEKDYTQDQWLSEFDRGDWIIGELCGQPICLMGVTRDPRALAAERYLEYIWVAPEYRRSHIAFDMLNAALGDLKKSGIQTIFLWVLDGNDAALWLYKQLDFASTSDRQPLKADPGRCEERLRLDLI